MLHRLPSVWAIALLCAAGAATPHASTAATWLDRVNFYRATASLPPVSEDPVLSAAVRRHARYMLMHAVVKHAENPRDRDATIEGAAAAAASNLAGSTHPGEPETWAVDLWMQAPFHAVGILDPALQQVGFAIEHTPRGRIQTAAGLDVLTGRTGAPIAREYPIVWPSNGARVPLAAYVDEYPSPLAGCDGYRSPAGLPLIVQLGPSAQDQTVTDSWIVDDDRVLEHCVFDGNSYHNPDPIQQQLGRGILAARAAIVLVPREPLHPGRTYRAVVDVGGRRIDWTFGIGQP